MKQWNTVAETTGLAKPLNIYSLQEIGPSLVSSKAPGAMLLGFRYRLWGLLAVRH